MKLLLMFSLLLSVPSFAVKADDILGIWYMEKNEQGHQTVVEVFKHQDKYYANGFAYKNYESNTPIKDTINPDPALRDRLIPETVFLYGLEFDGKNWINGEIYNIANGKYFHARATLKGDTLSIKASIDGKGLFGKTLTWTRSSNPEKYKSKQNSRDKLIKNIPTKRQK